MNTTHPLLIALASWPGRATTKSLLEAEGYWLPQRFTEIVLDHCGDCDLASLDRYWDEVALEYFASAGRADAIRRKFAGPTGYRSKYLDAQAALPQNRLAASRGLPLNDCLRVFKTRILAAVKPGVILSRLISDEMEKHKQIEIERLTISTHGWTGAKKDFTDFLRQAAAARGFIAERRRWVKNFGDDLQFSWSIDSGMRSTWKFQLPIVLEIVSKSAPDLAFCSPVSSIIMPGFQYYALYRSPESAVLGIRAHVDLFDTIGSMIASRLSQVGRPGLH